MEKALRPNINISHIHLSPFLSSFILHQHQKHKKKKQRQSWKIFGLECIKSLPSDGLIIRSFPFRMVWAAVLQWIYFTWSFCSLQKDDSQSDYDGTLPKKGNQSGHLPGISHSSQKSLKYSNWNSFVL